jgi:hypothetical protein
VYDKNPIDVTPARRFACTGLVVAVNDEVLPTTPNSYGFLSYSLPAPVFLSKKNK